MADTLESLEIQVVHGSSNAVDSIYEITESIRQMGKVLGDVLPQVKSFAACMRDISRVKMPSSWGEKQQAKLETPDVSGMQSLRDSLDGADIDAFSQALVTAYGDLENLVHVFGDIGRAAKEGFGILGSIITPVISAIKTATSAVIKFASSLAKIAVNGVKSAIKGIANAVNGLTDRVKKSSPALSNFINSLKRIAFYRLLRTIIKEITQAFKEGLENAYAFSQGIEGESHRFAEAMDSMSTAGQTMKNQLGSALISLLAAIAPIINTIIALITKLANAIAQLFAAFTGSTYLKSADVPKKWAEAAGGAGKAAKEWKNQLLGFDEINRLEEPSNGGGGGGGAIPDPMSMFEDAPINERIKAFVDEFKAAIMAGNWKGAGELLGNKINEIFPTNEQWSSWGQSLGYGLNGAIQTLYYALETIDFHAMGEGIATFLNNALEEIDFTYLGAILVRKITLALDFLMGFLGNLDWALIGKRIFEFLMGALREANDWLKSKDWYEIGKKMYQSFKDLISEIDFEDLAQTFFTFLGLAFGALVSLLSGFFEDIVRWIKDYFKENFMEAGELTWDGFKNGITKTWSNVSSWCKENIVDPFVNAVKSLLGIHSPSTVFESIGSSIIDGLQNGVSGAFSGFMGTVESLFGNLISWCQSAHAWIQDVLDGISLIGSGGIGGFIGGLFGVEKRASGGFVDEGQLFIANEAGAEMVGSIGSRTAVANNDQIVEGIRQGVFEAVMAANNNGNNNVDVRVYLDSREIKAGQNRLNRAMGVG